MWKMMAKGSVGLRVREVSPQNGMWRSEGRAAAPGWAAGGWEGKHPGMRARAGSELPAAQARVLHHILTLWGPLRVLRWGIRQQVSLFRRVRVRLGGRGVVLGGCSEAQ